jgi:hypothetical protein
VYYLDLHHGQIMRVSINGGVSEIVPGTNVSGMNHGGGFDVSRDGTFVVSLDSKSAENAVTNFLVLVSLDASQGPRRRLLDPDPRFSGGPVFTPDGKDVVYAISENGVDNLWLQPLNGSRVIKLRIFRRMGFRCSNSRLTARLSASCATTWMPTPYSFATRVPRRVDPVLMPIRSYQDFLVVWKDADPEVPILKEAKAECAKLR